MSQMDQAEAGNGKIGADKIILGLLAVLLIGAVFLVSGQRQQQLRSAPTGLDGLQIWLASEGQTARNFVGGWPLNADDIGLLILPLYDTILSDTRIPPTTEQELILQQDEYDLWRDPIISKIEEVPTLIVLPKWRSGMRLTGLAHPFLLVDQITINSQLADLLAAGDVRLTAAAQPFTQFDDRRGADSGQTATIYAAQTFSTDRCKPIIGTDKAMLLGVCQVHTSGLQTQFYVLSDPDLINNHGLALGDNAFIARDFVAEVAGGGQVVIDYSRENWLTRDEGGVARDRTWADLARFFAPPFTLMWVGLGIALLLTLWRAAMRFGPLLRTADGLGASKMMAIGARARLMRLSNRDGALVADYAKARLATTATRLVGAAHASQLSKPEAFLAYTTRRHPTLAKPLAGALNALKNLPHGATAQQAMAAAADLDQILEKIIHDT